ncbi:MAG: ABC transporter ATP-binding protein, partial [Nocardioidaceae bacterium]
ARYHARMSAVRLQAAFMPVVDLVELAGTLVVAGLGTYALSQGTLTLGGLLAFAAYLAQLYRPVRRLGQLVNTAYAASASAERVLEILDERPSVVDSPGADDAGRALGRVELDRVTFHYSTARPALADVSLTAEPGTVTAIVGANGAGKSSLVKLLLRFYDPHEGVVRLDGRPISELGLTSLRDNIAVVLQETLVLDASIRENIAYGSPQADEAAIVRAAKVAGVDEFAQAMSDGYDTSVGQRGQRLSGGQRQRLAIARAMVRDAPVLVLDEPTAGLDAASVERVRGPLRRLMADRTTLLVSHDLALTSEADQILVLDHGRLIETGGHAALVAAGGWYSRLWASQTGGDRELVPS